MRTPTGLLQRFGRQLLVEGVDLRGQMGLARQGVVLRGDGSPFAGSALEVMARYLAAAGLGRLTSPHIGDWALGSLDAALQLSASGPLAPPVTHLYVAGRPYGASVDLLAVPERGGAASEVRVCTAMFELGARAGAEDAALVGAAVADLVLGDLLGLQPLPAIWRLAWPETGDPQLGQVPMSGEAARRREAAPGDASSLAAPSLWAALARAPQVWEVVRADAERRYPLEACGLIVASETGALRAIVCDNLQDRDHDQDPIACPRTARTAFRLNELTIARAADQGETLVCIYHSHCDAGAYFSAEDIRCASPGGQPGYPGVVWMVLSVSAGAVCEAEAFHFEPDTGLWRAEAPPPLALLRPAG